MFLLITIMFEYMCDSEIVEFQPIIRCVQQNNGKSKCHHCHIGRLLMVFRSLCHHRLKCQFLFYFLFCKMESVLPPTPEESSSSSPTSRAASVTVKGDVKTMKLDIVVQ